MKQGLFILMVFMAGCQMVGSNEVKDAKSSLYSQHSAQDAADGPKLTLEDTLNKAELRAFVFLKMEYGVSRDAVDIAAQRWYQEQKTEVVKWRIRTGTEHVYVVTRTQLTGNDLNSYDQYNTWNVNVVNKFK